MNSFNKIIIIFFSILFLHIFFLVPIFSNNNKKAFSYFKIDHTAKPVKIDGYLNEWNLKTKIILNKKNLESGEISDDEDLKATFYFLWDNSFLYMAALIYDNEIISDLNDERIWMNDCIEIYLDPDNDGLKWQDKADFQFGFSPSETEESDKVKIWEWFHNNKCKNVKAKSKINKDEEYTIEAAIPWSEINIKPQKNKVFGLSIGLNDVDIEEDDTPKAKLVWAYFKRGNSVLLARFILK